MTITTEKTAAQLDDEKESEKDTNTEKKVFGEMHMAEKDESGPEIVGLKDKYAGNAFSPSLSLPRACSPQQPAGGDPQDHPGPPDRPLQQDPKIPLQLTNRDSVHIQPIRA